MNAIEISDRVQHVKEGITGMVVDIHYHQDRPFGVRWDGYRDVEYHSSDVLISLYADLVDLKPITFTPVESFLVDTAVPCDDCGNALCDGFCLDPDNEPLNWEDDN
jgi:hypothetical protein